MTDGDADATYTTLAVRLKNSTSHFGETFLRVISDFVRIKSNGKYYMSTKQNHKRSSCKHLWGL